MGQGEGLPVSPSPMPPCSSAQKAGMLILAVGALLIIGGCRSGLNVFSGRVSTPPTPVERLVPTPPLRPTLPTLGAAPAETTGPGSTALVPLTPLTPNLSQGERGKALTPTLSQGERGKALTPTLSQGERGKTITQALPQGERGKDLTPALPQEEREAVSLRARFGVGVAAELGPIEQYDVGRLGAGWYLDWRTNMHPPRPQGMEYAQMVSVFKGGFYPDLKSIAAIAAANPGSLWLIGNEPDVIWQGNVPPADYARSYHRIYFALKKADPSCQVAIGGVSQPTPLRFQYLDLILHAYRKLYGEVMPVDVWNVHAFILREEKDSWGVDIPPGIAATRGLLYEIEDHDDLEIFRQQIIAFRRWMKERGEREKALIISEYGILMPADYGFDHAGVRQFMYASFDFFLTATDDELGYPPDGNRLVQRWAWFSLSNEKYPTGNLFYPDTRQITPLGVDYAHYLSAVLPMRFLPAEQGN